MRGPKPKPAELELLQGKPGKRKINDLAPKPPKGSKPPLPPKHLCKVAKKEWRKISKQLFTLGLLTSIDSTALAAYCMSYARWVEAAEQIAENGMLVKSPSGYPMQSPYLAILNKAQEQMTKILTEFGMTPSSRTRIKVQPVKKKSKLEEFLGGKKKK